ncbi:response regulator transcription factor [Actinotalea lenta]|uniref:helix-turn-helix transcriptional regulator n=1 Tax=Actinotalea lenta TaxID=3064654 RepID=UPI003D9C7AC0
MSVEQVRTTPSVRGTAHQVHRQRAPFPPSQRTAPRETGAVCLVLPEIGDGEAPVIVRNLRRRDSSHAVLLARHAGRREIVTLLGGGVRGAMTTHPGAAPVGAAQVAARRGGPELTARELAVLELVADGNSNREIGEALELSALTVKSHLARISRKIGTGDRAEMVAHAIRHQLIA